MVAAAEEPVHYVEAKPAQGEASSNPVRPVIRGWGHECFREAWVADLQERLKTIGSRSVLKGP